MRKERGDEQDSIQVTVVHTVTADGTPGERLFGDELTKSSYCGR